MYCRLRIEIIDRAPITHRTRTHVHRPTRPASTRTSAVVRAMSRGHGTGDTTGERRDIPPPSSSAMTSNLVVDRPTKGALWPGLLFVAIPILPARMGLSVGVVVVGDKVISRGWFRKRTIPRAEISAVRAVNYSGYWNRSSSSKLFVMLELKVVGSEVEIPAVVSRPVKAHRLASQMTVALGFGANSDPVGKHRDPG